jgi:hypothetical protein
MAGTSGYGEERSSSRNAGNFLTIGKAYCYLLKKYSAPWSKQVSGITLDHVSIIWAFSIIHRDSLHTKSTTCRNWLF